MSQRELQDESDVFLWREDLEQIPQDEEDNEVIPGRGPISSPYLPESFDEMLQEAVDLTQTDADFSMPTENLSGLDSLSTNTLNGSLEPRLELQLIDLGPIIPEIIQMENERKKQIDDELERAACGHSLSDKLTGPGDSSGSDGDSKKQRRPQKRSLPRPPTLTFGDRCITPQRTNRTSLSPQAPLTPNSPRSPRSFRSHQTHRTEIHHHTFETTNRAPPSPVPPFVVVYTSGSAHVTVRPTSRALQNPSTVDEEIINSNLSLWRRGCLFFWTALLFLATVTMIAGLVRTQKLRQGSGSDDPKFKIPSIQNQTFLPTTSLNPAQTQSPGFIISNEDNDGGSIIPPLNIQTGDDDEQVLSGFRDETSSPAGAPPTWPPRTRAPVPGPSSSPSTVLADDGDYDEDIDEVSSGFRDETPCPEGASPTGPPRTRAPVSAPTSPTQDYVKDVITNMLNTSFAELSNPNPPRSRALEWIALDPLVEDRTYSDSRIFQRWVLATFFYSTGGDSWYDSNGWVSYTDDCTWFSTRNGHRICDAKGNLEVLDLEHNNLSGSIPHELGILSNSLKRIFLRDNALDGSLPTQLGMLNRLQYLQLTHNDLKGPIPTEYGNLSRLIVLGLGRNAIEATLPSELGRLGRLDTLGLEGNSIFGTIPAELGNMRNMRLLALSDNAFSGNLPSELGALSRLVKLSLFANDLVGVIPNEVCDLTKSTLTVLTADCDGIFCPCCHRCYRDPL